MSDGNETLKGQVGEVRYGELFLITMRVTEC